MTSGADARSDECRAILQHIAAYLDGELDATECRRIEAHCRQCAACHAVVGGLRQTVGLCREAATVPLPEPVRERALASVRRLLSGTTASDRSDSDGSGR